MKCETTDFMFPMLADVFYPVVEQGAYGNVSKTWSLDRTVAGNFVTEGKGSNKEEVRTAQSVSYDTNLAGRVRSDLRMSSTGQPNAITNVVISNIRDSSGNEVYVETAGPRAGKSTIFEVATQKPFIGPFGSTDHYAIILRRSENQAVDI
jgi:hypothetical protein